MTKQKKSFLDRTTSEEPLSKLEKNDFKPKPSKDYLESDSYFHTNYNASSLAPAGTKQETADNSEGQLTVDVYHTDKYIMIRSIVGGANPSDIDIDINNGMVTIKGIRRIPEEINPENYYYRECFWGKFSRSIVLPEEIDVEKTEASLKNGILTIKLPRAEKAKMKKIQVMGE